MTPKFKLKCDIVYRAQGNTNHESSTVASVSDQCVTPQTQKTVNCALQVPRDLGLSIQNCDLISVEYRLKVRDDVIDIPSDFLLHRVNESVGFVSPPVRRTWISALLLIRRSSSL